MKKTTIFLLTLLVLFLSSAYQLYADVTPILHKSVQSLSAANPVSGTVKVCALRVAFKADDNEATTGNGKFLVNEVDLPCDDANFPVIDPPPHTNAYFRDHIRSLSNFYNHASSGKLIIDTTNSMVFPLSDDSVYTLSRKMEYYHPFLKDDSVDVRLTELLVEAIQLADKDDDIDFSLYDVVVVFHAGVGQDFAIDLDPTPYDIPSAFLNSDDIADYFASIGSSGNSVLVDGNFPITEGLLLPESQNHLLYDNWEDVFGGTTTPCDYQIGLNGTFAFMMGFYMGLPGLYNTETGETGVGKFGLMDQGSANLNGLVPTFPSAWERKYMGWDTPVVVDGFEDVKLQYAESGSDTTLWMIPINDNEYFLLENRYTHIRPGVYLDSIQYKQYLKNDDNEWPPLVPLIVDSIGAVFSAETGVLLSVPRYDVGLPGSGLLIWHIDESVIEANLATNSINNDRNHFGVDLEEGDGAQDFGFASNIIGANVDIGWYFDPWFAGNEGFWDLNADYPQDDEKRVGFTNATHPSSRSWSYAYTGIVVDSIGPSAAVMNFRIGLDYKLDGFEIPGTLTDSWDDNKLFLFPYNFNINNAHTELLTILDNPVPVFFTFNESGTQLDNQTIPISLSSPAVLQFIDSYYFLGFRDTDMEDTLKIWEGEISNTGAITVNSDARKLIGNRILSNRLAYNNRLIFCVEEEQTGDYYLIAYYPEDNSTTICSVDIPLYRIVSDGNIIYSDSPTGDIITIDPATLEVTQQLTGYGPGIQSTGLAYMDNDQMADLSLVYSDKLLLIPDIQNGNQEVFRFDGEFDSTLAFSDIDGDGKVEIIAKNATQIYVFNENLILENNFPISVPNLFRGNSFFPHVLTTDVDGDRVSDIIVTLENTGVLAYNYYGDLIDGYPRAMPNSATEQSILMENENGTFILSANLDGTALIGLYLTDKPMSENAWYCYGGDVEHSFRYSQISQSETSMSDNLLNKQKTFNWPNPTRNDRTAIRYYPTADSNIDITIYDLAGNFIKSFSDSSPLINDYNEIEWDVGNIANGVYLAVVTASSGSKSESKIVKIMVIH